VGAGVGGKVAVIKTTPGVRRDAGRGAPEETQAAGRKARADREGNRFPRRMSRPPGVSGGERRRGERDVRRSRPTLHSSRRGGGFDRRGRSTLHRRTLSRQERGWREEDFHVAQKGTVFSPGEPGEEAESTEETEENRLLQLLK
jgi:hypothetical protein